jgi:hypothetical protein
MLLCADGCGYHPFQSIGLFFFLPGTGTGTCTGVRATGLNHAV